MFVRQGEILEVIAFTRAPRAQHVFVQNEDPRSQISYYDPNQSLRILALLALC